MSEMDDTHDSRTPKRMRKAQPGSDGQIDLSAALEAPVRIKRDGEVKAIDPYEAMLRQHVRKSLVEKCVASMKLVLGEAAKHKLIKVQPPPIEGGVFVVPKDLPEDIQQEIFAVPDNPSETPVSIIPTMMLVFKALGIKRLKRCFNGRKD